jgi:7-keto-8-aminopelargonate synthetase-like enzyme
MHELGFDTLGSETPIVPVVIGEDETALRFWRGLWDSGVFTTPAVAPAVPQGRAIIRTSVNANHTEAELQTLLDAFEAVGKQLGVI